MLNTHLLNQLNSALGINLARLKCLTLIVSNLLRHRTVNLTILATENLTGDKNESCYRRFQDFFLNCTIPLISLGRFVLGKVPMPSEGWTLSMDRTNWKYGKRHINILTIGVRDCDRRGAGLHLVGEMAELLGHHGAGQAGETEDYRQQDRSRLGSP